MGSGDSGESCLRSSPARDGHTRVTFLREDAWGARSLYLSLWSEDRRLVTCEVNSSPLATESYRTLCGRSDTQLQDEEFTRRFNFSVLAAPDSPCAPQVSRRTRRTGTEGKVRRKRGWLFPGTLWCGRGSEAVRYEQLGMFENADRCCREHDHCSHIIPSFTVNYGVFNSYFYTLSHCDCDQRFRQCLLEVNDTISSMVSYSFFNILRIPCFELKQQKRCTQMYWWGMCKVAKEAPYAIFKSPLPYKTSDVSSKYGDSATRSNLTSSERQQVTESPAISPRRKSPKRKHRCGPRAPPRGDTFYLRTKGRRCKTRRIPSTVAPSQMAPISRARTTTPSTETARLNATKLITVVSHKKRVGKKKRNRKGLLVSTTQRRQVPKQASTNSNPGTSSTTQSSLSVTRRQQLYPTAATTAEIKTKRSHKKGRKQSRCCGFRRADTLRPLCKRCLEQETTTDGPPIKVTKLQNPQQRETTDTPEPDNLKIQLNTTTFATPIRTKLKTTASLRKDGESLRQMDSHLLGNNTSQKHMGSNTTQSPLVGISFKENNTVTDSQLLCGSLRYLDDCKYQIPPLEKKYDLQNMESKTAYHCDCTTRLALQIKSSKQPRVLPTLLMDFISQYCFKLPKENKCRRRKSCSGGFIKASDLLRTLKKMEGKDSGGVQNSGNERKRGIPVRLYKRCLRLEREADIMAQLT
ncbi:group 3 secretory phospholipase A2 [Hippoglossus stenolepis]|uniref:group 3 secretory phospholipase A2 n=1 Tax=Hippoglossus stenolepis TaxID=195615 RepID=UPI001FAFCF8C|nr:group 3 secretory phospholipase A2 [Hippoglossus stenolepis]